MGFFNRNVYQADMDLADHFSGLPTPSFWSRWFGGVIVPFLLTAYAVKCFLTREATMVGRHNASIDLSDEAAVVYGLVWLSGALILHFHYFWSSLRRLWVVADLGKAISLICFIGALGYVIWAVLAG